MSRKQTEPCGCTFKSTPSGSDYWIEMCPQHKQEHDELHTRAMADWRANKLVAQDDPTD